jgi:hypothetical protein
MNTFIKLKQIDGRLALLDLSIIEGFYERPGEPGTSIAYYKANYVMKDKPQDYIQVAHSVDEIANAICGQTSAQDCTVVDLTMDKLDEESDTEKPNTDYDREASEI